MKLGIQKTSSRWRLTPGKRKRCRICKKVLRFKLFYKTALMKDGMSTACKLCINARCRDPRVCQENFADKRSLKRVTMFKLYSPEWQKDFDLRRNFGVSLAEYTAILKKQKGGCAVCGSRVGNRKKQLSLDHDPETGEPRGILCGKCNFALGLLKDSIKLVKKLLQYREKYA